MALKLGIPSMFKKNMFEISPEDNQSLVFAGDRQIPAEVQQTIYSLQDDFTTINAGKWSTSVNTGGSITASGGVTTIFCTDDAGTGYCVLYSVGSWSFQNYEKMTFEARIKHVLPDQTLTFDDVSIGLSNSETFAGTTDAIFFRKYEDSGDKTTFNLYNKKDGVVTDTGSATLADNTWYNLKIIARQASIEFYVDDLLIGTHSTNIPNDIAMKVIFRIYQTNHLDAYLYVDNISLKLE